ncbi:MAG: hypothetical protein HYX61_09990 [Gammaproteobacteria bacterium]|jgi:hypothetical protein|nr:hypothetical protein [Gammaproteobacteria bacterium]
MSIKRILFCVMVMSSLGLSSNVFAYDRSSGDRSGEYGEMNHDNDLQGAEASSDAMTRRRGTPIQSIDVGVPSDPDYSYNKNREEMRNHR